MTQVCSSFYHGLSFRPHSPAPNNSSSYNPYRVICTLCMSVKARYHMYSVPLLCFRPGKLIVFHYLSRPSRSASARHPGPLPAAAYISCQLFSSSTSSINFFVGNCTPYALPYRSVFLCHFTPLVLPTSFNRQS